MSGMALILAANVKGLKPAAKIVLIQLADFHNKETGQCNSSAQRLADECEMGCATLFRHMTTLEECGFVTRHARGDGDGGRGSNQYELHLDITLGPSARPKGGGNGPNRVSSQNETVVVSNRDTNLTIEPKKEPPLREREAVVTEKILGAYPPDRLRGRAICLAQIEEALKEGIAPEDLLQAIQTYATGSAGFTRSKVCFSDNWFKSGRWRAYVENIAKDREETTVKQAEMLESLAGWVTDRHLLCRHITAKQIDGLLASKLVTQAQIQADSWFWHGHVWHRKHADRWPQYKNLKICDRRRHTMDARTPLFPSAFDVAPPKGAEDWQDLYPYYTRFLPQQRAADDARFWFCNSQHYPTPFKPFDVIMLDFSIKCLGAYNSRTWMVPPANGVDYRILNGYIYFSPVDVAPEDI